MRWAAPAGDEYGVGAGVLRGLSGSCSFSSCMSVFVIEQPALARDAAGVTGQLAIGADDAMAGHDDTDRICTIRCADSAARARAVELRRECAIRRRAARVYSSKSRP